MELEYINEKIGRKIRDLRNRNGLTQQELADRAGITRSSVAVHISNLMKKGYITDSTVDCYFVENVEVKQEYVDRSLIMNLGYIAEILNETKEGEVTYTVKSGDSYYSIAGEYGISVDTLMKMNPGYDPKILRVGDVLTISNAVPYLTVVNVERQRYVQDVPYEVEYTDDASMYQGEYKVTSPGVYGKADVTANVTYINGEEQERTVISSVTLSDPVVETRARGTKVRPTWYPTGSFRWPCSGRITSYFGYRSTGIRGATSNHKGIAIACGDGRLLRILELQAEGGKRMAAADYLRGHPVPLGL